MAEQSGPNGEPDVIKFNETIAYKGDIGRKRETFCIDFINHKKEILRDVQADQLNTTLSNGENISCHEGCTHCCALYLQASIPECEAIVYYLYHHQDVLAAFLANYRKWRRQLKENGDIFKKCGDLWQATTDAGAGEEAQRALKAETWRYQQQGLLCPFIQDGACSIYEVRPYTCAGTIATTPTQYCMPGGPGKAKVYQTRIPAVLDNSFYYLSIDGPVLGFMPLVVYGILKEGYRLLANVPGLAGLDEVALSDRSPKQ